MKVKTFVVEDKKGNIDAHINRWLIDKEEELGQRGYIDIKHIAQSESAVSCGEGMYHSLTITIFYNEVNY